MKTCYEPKTFRPATARTDKRRRDELVIGQRAFRGQLRAIAAKLAEDPYWRPNGE